LRKPDRLRRIEDLSTRFPIPQFPLHEQTLQQAIHALDQTLAFLPVLVPHGYVTVSNVRSAEPCRAGGVHGWFFRCTEQGQVDQADMYRGDGTAYQ
jgi:hypothetical protein